MLCLEYNWLGLLIRVETPMEMTVGVPGEAHDGNSDGLELDVFGIQPAFEGICSRTAHKRYINSDL